MSRQLIQAIDERAARAWPALFVEDLDGWRLRFTYNVTGRANSVLPINPGRHYSLDERLRRVEAFYRRWNAPIRYQITPAARPAELEQVLIGQGFQIVAPTLVQAAPLAEVLDHLGSDRTHDVHVTQTLHERWFDTYCRLEDLSDTQAGVIRGILQRIRQPTAYILVTFEGRPIGTGLGVVDGSWCGIFCVVIDPAFRRIGAARSMLRALAQSVQRQRASRLYLQVTEQNSAARALYARSGFETLYGYHYCVLDPSGSTT